MMSNLDPKVVRDFGDEWQRFDQRAVPEDELRRRFEGYFSVFPWADLPAGAVGFDLGCGSGRWAKLVAPRVGTLHCIDASAAALAVAREQLADLRNCVFHEASVDAIPLSDGSMDFGYSLGVLHHIPDTEAGLRSCVAKLKVGAPMLIYLYYAFDNRPAWFRALWKSTDLVRKGVSILPQRWKNATAQAIALAVYLPLARAAAVLDRKGFDVSHVPLSFYRDKSLYTMKTDALDRFGTRLEQRFTRRQIADMMCRAGLSHVAFSNHAPFWCAAGIKTGARPAE